VAEKYLKVFESFKGLDFWFERVGIGDGKKFGEELFGLLKFLFLLVDKNLGWFGHEKLNLPSVDGFDKLFFNEFLEDVIGVDSRDFGFLSNGTGITSAQF